MSALLCLLLWLRAVGFSCLKLRNDLPWVYSCNTWNAVGVKSFALLTLCALCVCTCVVCLFWLVCFVLKLISLTSLCSGLSGSSQVQHVTGAGLCRASWWDRGSPTCYFSAPFYCPFEELLTCCDFLKCFRPFGIWVNILYMHVTSLSAAFVFIYYIKRKCWTVLVRMTSSMPLNLLQFCKFQFLIYLKCELHCVCFSSWTLMWFICVC